MNDPYRDAPRPSPDRARVTGAILACLVLAGLPWIALAEGGSKSQKGKKGAPTVTVTESGALPADAPVAEAPTDADGGINPTNVAVTSEDLFTVAAVTDYDVLLGADQVRGIATGRGITVAVLDGGFNVKHPAIVENVLHDRAFDALDRDDDVSSHFYVDDDDVVGLPRALGHGTFVIGMVLKSAPEASILPVRVADDDGNVWSSAVVEGILHAVAQGAHVINLSVEFDELDRSVTKALTYAARAGVVLVTSAGNSASDGLRELAASGQTIAVGATDRFDCVAGFSNTNDPWEWDHLVFAPGVDLHGPSGFPAVDSACVWSGTSFSAGLVSGAMALSLELAPSVWPGDLVYSLLTSVAPVYDSTGTVLLLTGRLDLVCLAKHACAMEYGAKINSLDTLAEEPTEASAVLEPVVLEADLLEPLAPVTTEPEATTSEPVVVEKTNNGRGQAKK